MKTKKNSQKQENWLESKKATAFFAIIAFIGGVLFIEKSITGNIILNNNSYFDLVSLIGLLLILCAIILGVYSWKKK